MDDVQEIDSEPPSITAVIAQRVREARLRLGLSQAELAAQMTEHGVSWNRSAVVNLERRASGGGARGREAGRNAITVQEWMALARVLGEAPLWLLAPPAVARDARGASGSDPWLDLFWIVGHPIDDPERMNGHGRGHVATIEAARQVVDLVEDLDRVDGFRALQDRARPGEPLPFDVDEAQRGTLRELGSALVRLDTVGLVRPSVPERVLKRAEELGVELPAPVT